MRPSKQILLPVLAFFALSQAPLRAQTWEERHADQFVLTLDKEYDVEIFMDYTYSTRSLGRFKIQNAEAIKGGLGEFQRDYNPRFDKLKLEAYVTTPDGKRTHHTKVQDKAKSGDNAVYDDTHVVTLTVPRLSVGSTVELIVTYHNHTPRVPGQVEGFRTLDPPDAAKRTRYSITWPKAMDILFAPANGLAKVDPVDVGGKWKREWIFQDLDEIPSEPNMPPMEHVARSLGYSLWNDWARVDAFFAPLVAEAVQVTPSVQALAEQLMAKSTATAVRIQEVYNFIDDNIRYVSVNLGQNGLTPHPAGETLKNLYGDCKDRAALAIALLSAMGIKAQPVLVAPALPEIDDRLPRWGYFNHMITAVEYDGLHFVESTDGNFAFNDQHPGLDGAQVFIIDGQGGRRLSLPWEDISQPTWKETKIISLQPDGSGRMNVINIGDRGSIPTLRTGARYIASLPPALQEKFKQECLAELESGMEQGEIKFLNADQRFGRVPVHVNGRVPNLAKLAGPLLVYDLEPEDHLAKFPEGPRAHPLWFTGTSYARTETALHIPAGYRVEHLPKDFEKATDYIRFKRTCRLKGDTFTVVEERWVTSARLPATEYGRLRRFHQQLKDASIDSLILRQEAVNEARRP